MHHSQFPQTLQIIVVSPISTVQCYLDGLRTLQPSLQHLA